MSTTATPTTFDRSAAAAHLGLKPRELNWLIAEGHGPTPIDANVPADDFTFDEGVLGAFDIPAAQLAAGDVPDDFEPETKPNKGKEKGAKDDDKDAKAKTGFWARKPVRVALGCLVIIVALAVAIGAGGGWAYLIQFWTGGNQQQTTNLTTPAPTTPPSVVAPTTQPVNPTPVPAPVNPTTPPTVINPVPPVAVTPTTPPTTVVPTPAPSTTADPTIIERIETLESNVDMLANRSGSHQDSIGGLRTDVDGIKGAMSGAAKSATPSSPTPATAPDLIVKLRKDMKFACKAYRANASSSVYRGYVDMYREQVAQLAQFGQQRLEDEVTAITGDHDFAVLFVKNLGVK